MDQQHDSRNSRNQCSLEREHDEPYVTANRLKTDSSQKTLSVENYQIAEDTRDKRLVSNYSNNSLM